MSENKCFLDHLVELADEMLDTIDEFEETNYDKLEVIKELARHLKEEAESLYKDE